MSFDYKKYSLEHLENWLHDAMSSSDATVEEIYNCIYKVVNENYDHHKHYASQAYELMSLLNGNGTLTSTIDFKIKENTQYTDEELDAMCNAAAQDSKPTKKSWIIPVEEVHDGDTDEVDYTITFPQDMLDHTGWMEGDEIEWIDRKDGTFEIRKVGEPK